MAGPFHKENKMGADVSGRWSLGVVFLSEQDSAGRSGSVCEPPVGALGVPLWMEGASLPDLTLSPHPCPWQGDLSLPLEALLGKQGVLQD